jgi:uroporphyrinogen decarboxylase
MFYDDPNLMAEMMEYLADLFIKVLHRAVHEVDVDFALFWEDMCYKAGPLISPAMFREFLLPNYKKVTKFLVEHGVELSWVDCDGNIEALLPLWIEGGVIGHYPLEVASGMDAGKLRDEYGQSIVMWGNVDKRALAKGKEAIDAEIERLAPVVAKGGFIPLVDHGVPEDISYENYCYYLERRKQITGYS